MSSSTTNSSNNSNNNNTNSSLRPAWYRGNQPGGGGGRGFQPPPQVGLGTTTTRSLSLGTTTTTAPSSTSDENHTTRRSSASSNFNNKFAALNDDDDVVIASSLADTTTTNHVHSNTTNTNNNSNNGSQGGGATTSIGTTSNSRSEALRASGLNRNTSTGSRPSGGGRKLSEYAATVPNTTGSGGGGGGGSGRFHSLRNHSIGSEREAYGGSGTANSSSNPTTSTTNPTSSSHTTTTNSSTATAAAVDNVKVLRYTRERLLSMRPTPLEKPSTYLVERLEGSSILSEVPQDPVCWDTFDGEEIWANAPRRASASSSGAAGATSKLLSGGSGPPTAGTGIPAEDGLLLQQQQQRRSGSGNTAGVPLPRSRGEGGTTGGGGRWQRGVALPPPDEAGNNKRGGGRDQHLRDADDPSDLWDDPGSAADGVALDFSAFGAIPADDNNAGAAAFDFEKLAEATQKFEEQLHGGRSRASSNAENSEKELDHDDIVSTGDNIPHNIIKVDPKRPLASDGTTIRSGSGDNVNVFEDFDDPASSEGEESNVIPAVTAAPPVTVKAADENPDASSRLMALIGVTKEEDENIAVPPLPVPTAPAPVNDHVIINPMAVAAAVPPPTPVPVWGLPDPMLVAPSQSGNDGGGGLVLGLSLNPWSDSSVLNITGNDHHHRMTGLDIQARLREAELEQQQKAREQEELLLRRRHQEEAQRRAMTAAAQQQAAAAAAEEERLRQVTIQQQQQQQQQAGVQSQVENVLMERISTILENSWGRSDLISILSTLHSEDSRVIPLLSSTDALRALLIRNPQRVALRQDPSLRAEMAALLMTNAQWQQQQASAQQQQQQQHAQRLRAQQEEMQRREQQLRLLEEQQQQQQQQAAMAAARAQQHQQQQHHFTIIPDAPWYYSDPQKNIQGPFRGEEMRQWFEAGYFKGDLPISQQPMGPFRPLSLIFPDLSLAFMLPQRNSIAAEEVSALIKANEERARLEAAERMEAAQQAAEAAERERLLMENERRAKEIANERERRAREAAAERQRLVRESADRSRSTKDAVEAANRIGGMIVGNHEAAADSNNGGNESSTQLKLLLGLNSNHASDRDNDMMTSSAMAEPKSKQQQQQSMANKATEKKAFKSSNKNNQLQPLVTEQTMSSPYVAPMASPAAPAWGGAAAAKPTTRKTMSEIQKEEERAAAAAMKHDGTKPSSTDWANVAASRGGGNAWVGGTAPQKPAVVLSKQATGVVAAPVPLPGKAAIQQSRSTSIQASTSSAAPVPQLARAASAGPAPTSTESSTAVAPGADAFGAKMSPQLEKWCKDQMQKLNGTDDLTLVSFCMTLNDPGEIRQYITTYLGATPSVNNFATEFINRAKGGINKEKSEEWESTVTVKKSKKKKSGGGSGTGTSNR